MQQPLSNPPAVLKVRWFFLWLLVSIPVGIGLYVFIGEWLVSSEVITSTEDPLVEALIGVLWTYGLLGGWSWWCLAHYHISFGRLIGKVPPHFDWRPTLFLIIPMMLYSLAAFWIVHFPLASEAPDYLDDILSQRMFVEASESASPDLTNLVIFLTVVIAAPVFEELFFRGILFSRWCAKWGFTRSLLLSSFLFGILHADIVGAFIFGCAMCVVYMKTRTLWVPIVIHAIYNLIAAGLAFGFDPTGDISVANEDLDYELYVALILMVVSSPFIFGLLGRWWPSGGDQIPYEANTIAGSSPVSN